MKLPGKYKTIYIASDHAGFRLKSFIIEEYLAKKKFNFFDLGTNSDKSVDYPKFAKKLCKNINQSSMGANRHKHIRASLCHNAQTAKMTRKHNNSNVICLKGRPFVKKNIFAMLNAYFKTEFDKGRHLRRISQL